MELRSLESLVDQLMENLAGMTVSAITLDEPTGIITVQVATTGSLPACPRCHTPALRQHSRYTRSLTDIPWAAHPLRVQVTIRKCFCANPACTQRVFAERVPQLAAPWARRTQRLADQQRQLGLALGGVAAERLATHLHLGTSHDTFLRLIRRTPLPPTETPTILGVDDWALCKGIRYGTILIDLERGRPIELLDDRSSEVLATWLADHPGVTLISRDRAGTYAEGARRGAPHAIQVADRWHILKNLSDALIAVLDRHHVAIAATLRPPPTTKPIAEAPPPHPSPVTTDKQTQQQERRAARVARYTRVRALHQHGWTLSAIADELGLDRDTVRKFVTADTFPERRPRAARRTLLQPYLTTIHTRWDAGCYTGAVILREIIDQGYTGSRSTFNTYITGLRQATGVPPKKRTTAACRAAHDAQWRPPSARSLAAVVLRRAEKRTADDTTLLTALQALTGPVATAITLTQEFATFVRTRDVAALAPWLERAHQSELRSFLGFVKGIRRDLAAVRASLTEPWSNGPTEGHINRLKCLKRQMYGRAKLDLLKLRLIAG